MSCGCEAFQRKRRKLTPLYYITVIAIILLATRVAVGIEKCFCELKGQIDDCCCSVETVDKLNNIHIYPRISSLVSNSKFFRYFKINLNKACPFWPDDSRCALKDCAVDVCSGDEIPIGISKTKESQKSSLPENKQSHDEKSGQCATGELETLGNVNQTISEEQIGNFEQWTVHDDQEDKFCDIDDENLPGMEYVDLILNPERYTGYSGFSARRVWNSIYKENCFIQEEPKMTYATFKTTALDSMCLERRVFYRAISGMHASINIHLSYNYLLSGNLYGKNIWGPNVKEFHRRFDPEFTKDQGPQWLKNLYTTYLLVLRAVSKARPFWEKESFFTGDEAEDKMVKSLVLEIVDSIEACPSTFDESLMFSGNPTTAKSLKEEFRSHFYNVTRIMDCVGCDKCRLWGKLQTQGLGTAFKILFSSTDWNTIPFLKGKEFKLTRSEIVALFNVFGRLSSSVHALKKFREMGHK